MQIQSTIRTKPQYSQPALRAGDSLLSKTESGEPGPSKLNDTFQGIGLGAAASLGGAAYPTTWLHEMGHAKTIELLYEGANPEVEVFPFKGGVTRWRLGPLSDLGKRFGHDGSRALVSAAGTVVDMGVATTAFGAGFSIRKKHPIAGTALMGFGAMSVLNSISYASTAVGGDLVALAKEGNDFANLAVKAGIHPLASIAIMAAILPLQYAGMKYIESKLSEG